MTSLFCLKAREDRNDLNPFGISAGEEMHSQTQNDVRGCLALIVLYYGEE